MRVDHRFFTFVERFVAAILGRSGDLVVASAQTSPFDPAAAWVHFGREEAATVAVAWGNPRSDAAQGAVEVATAQRVGRGSVLRGWGVAPRFAGVFPCCQTRVELLSVDAPSRAVWFASTLALCSELADVPGGVETRIRERATVAVPIVLRGITTVLQRGALVFCDVCGVVLASGTRWSRQWERRGDGFRVTLEEEMEERAHGERIQALDMGVMVDVVVNGFELKLGEVLGLRPGSEVFFPSGPEVRGTARVAGGAVATVTLAFEPGGLVARVIDLTPLVQDAGRSGNATLICPIQSPESQRASSLQGGAAPGEQQKLTLVEES